MKKYLILLLLSAFLLCSCAYDRGTILVYSQPVKKETVQNDEKNFRIGEKIYYLFLAPKRMENEYIRVQIFKMTDKAHKGGYEIVRRKDFRLMKDQRYYHSDYFVLHEKGRYVMQVFSIDNLQYPLSLNDFYVK